MTARINAAVEGKSRRATGRVLDSVIRAGQPLVIVDSPPGAGKTTLVETVTATAVQHARLRVAVIAPRAEQIYDILRRVVSNFDQMPLQILQAAQRELPPGLAGTPGV